MSIKIIIVNDIEIIRSQEATRADQGTISYIFSAEMC